MQIHKQTKKRERVRFSELILAASQEHSYRDLCRHAALIHLRWLLLLRTSRRLKTGGRAASGRLGVKVKSERGSGETQEEKKD